MVNDIIADSLTRLRNASMRRLEFTQLYYAKIVVSILEIFKEKGFIKDFNIKDKDKKQSVYVQLAYDEKGYSKISEVKRLSKPGRRVYKQKNELKRFKNGYGVIVVSTSKGVITNEEAYRQNVGGEVLCSIW
ncbi:30S ribosomal protein S8 [Helicobacter acinonychis]|uniref:Small ribosomal subunit protein uS8 n=1 Tax=Helicobacter acinonychis (strain Sheeba) TaxID=382638 RepID=RS8_HELAH|nr:30S ribosomal protein S8 [Helicobacter acinonychis]Q17ZC5.1 RecName: Full=Small ribosomal subunit protein uS8; AltName: Full=30S ribosomal protein S8 [Helicobacter acinonychis str. Sheeba]WQV00753.1 30S ribosomal protein S8 [Helicobacter pylori]WQW17713.1 30S ribosomal protein S8 [Helicobacter pylori]WQZ31117.1 30S ribosomal protein S8 [Helicobacter pylori]CAJ99001.1 30S ribosomal protein S8 [Helicobacter acinonychis str. Sheeba]STP04878.1 30S ribosomal protein S8 [Helicobacter acinonychis